MALLISVVDDDQSVRQSLNRLMRSAHLDVRVFASAEEFLESAELRKPDCLILDVQLPGMSGPNSTVIFWPVSICAGYFHYRTWI